MAVIQAGIIRVIAKNRYHSDDETRIMFDKTNIEWVVLEDSTTY